MGCELQATNGRDMISASRTRDRDGQGAELAGDLGAHAVADAGCHGFAGRVQGQRTVNSHRESMLNRRRSETHATAPGKPSKSLTSLATVMSRHFPVFGGWLTQPRPHAASSARFSQGEGNVPPRMIFRQPWMAERQGRG